MMELSDFISKALADIAEGIEKGRHEASKHGVLVGFPLYQIGERVTTTSSKTPKVGEIVFDIAVSASITGEAKATIKVLSFDFAGASGELAKQTTSKIHFSVPVLWQPLPKR